MLDDFPNPEGNAGREMPPRGPEPVPTQPVVVFPVPSVVFRPLVWGRAVLRSDLPGTVKRTLLALVIYADSVTGMTFKGVDTMASDLGMDRRTVRRHLHAAVERGYLIRQLNAEGRKTYTWLTVPLEADTVGPKGWGGWHGQPRLPAP